MELKAILFDLDGTLVDTEEFYIDGTYEYMIKLGYTGPKSDVSRIVGTIFPESYIVIADMLDNRYSVEEIEKINTKYFYEDHLLDYRKYIFDDVAETIKELSNRGYRLAICSSNYRDEIKRCLVENGIDSYIDAIITGYECQHAKPAPDVYLKALEVLNIKREEALIYEDSTAGILAGKNAGILTIAREEKRFPVDQSAADKIVKDINGLMKVIEDIK